MSAYWWYLAVGVAAVFGFFVGTAMGRIDRDTDALTINGLREALVRTQKALTEANAVKDEAVAAQEVAERTLKEQFERRSNAAKEAWKNRRLPTVGEVDDAA